MVIRRSITLNYRYRKWISLVTTSVCEETEWSDRIGLVRAESEIGYAHLRTLFDIEGRSAVSQVGCPLCAWGLPPISGD